MNNPPAIGSGRDVKLTRPKGSHTIDVRGFPKPQADIFKAIRSAKRGTVKAAGFDSESVAFLVQNGWISWWMSRSSITFTSWGASMFGLKLSVKRKWRPDQARQSRDRIESRKYEVSATDADVNLDGPPDGWQPRSSGNGHHPGVFLGSDAVWHGPDIGNLAGRPDRECQVCGHLTKIPRSTGCLKCDRMAGEKPSVPLRRRTA